MRFKRGSGVLAHPTSFPSEYGIGDLGKNAIKFIDFLKSSKQGLWQVLPLGPTSFGDSPYQSFSTFAGNPLLISPDILKEEGLLNENDLAGGRHYSEKVEYGEVIKKKNLIFQEAFKKFNLKSKDFTLFCKKNSSWLNDYALFVSIKNHFIKERDGTINTNEYNLFKNNVKSFLSENQINDYFYGAVWSSWSDDIKRRDKKALEAWSEKLQNEIAYQKFLQYKFFSQWEKVHEYANENRIKIIGDIPIFVAYDSSDVWSNPELFYLDKYGFPTEVAGVPPDYFSETGQLWGNPLYDWQKHKNTGYSWWIKRISQTLSMVDILRIDHFRGFDEYWAVPIKEKTAINGTWQKGPGKELFNGILAELGELPIIAEDLGLITETVRELKNYFSFPGMRVLQFAFESAEPNEHLPHFFETPNMVVYSGTHDNDTSLGWYNNVNESSKDYFRRFMNINGNTVAWDFIRLAMASVADIAIIPIQDLMQLDSNSRMNVPGIAAGNWQFKYQEDMLTDGMCEELSYLSELFNRNM